MDFWNLQIIAVFSIESILVMKHNKSKILYHIKIISRYGQVDSRVGDKQDAQLIVDLVKDSKIED